jgi:hypothetical protein
MTLPLPKMTSHPITMETTHKFPPCDEQVAMLQQKVRGKDKGDMVYVWF